MGQIFAGYVARACGLRRRLPQLRFVLRVSAEAAPVRVDPEALHEVMAPWHNGILRIPPGCEWRKEDPLRTVQHEDGRRGVATGRSSVRGTSPSRSDRAAFSPISAP